MASVLFENGGFAFFLVAFVIISVCLIYLAWSKYQERQAEQRNHRQSRRQYEHWIESGKYEE